MASLVLSLQFYAEGMERLSELAVNVSIARTRKGESRNWQIDMQHRPRCSGW